MKKFKSLALIFCLMLPWMLFGCENKNSTSLSIPANISVSEGVITFGKVKNAEYYTISINDELEFVVDPKYNKNVSVVDNFINYDANKIFSDWQTYIIKIKANSKEKKDSKYSTAITYKHSPSISKPDKVKINGTTLTWDLVENASYYLVRVVTPNETLLFDTNGDVIENVNPLTISTANLAEYSFNLNQFDFSSILSSAGNYDFYVCSVLSDGISITTSEYSNKATYTNYIKLNTPVNGNISKVDNELHLISVIDYNANAITISCGEISKQVELNGANKSITTSNNVLDINLNKYFSDYIASNLLDFSKLGKLSFKVQANYVNSNINNLFYLNSDFSGFVTYENTKSLNCPTNLNVALSDASNNYVASWQNEENNLVGYQLYVATSTEVLSYQLNSDANNVMIDDDYKLVFLQSTGGGNYTQSNFAVYPVIPSTSALNCTISGLSLSWNSIANSYYVLEFNNQLVVTNQTTYSLNISDFTNNNLNLKIYAISNNANPICEELNLNANLTLSAPSNLHFAGDVNNIYQLKFNAVENAIGYYVYIVNNSNETVKIDTLFTENSINLSQYLATEKEDEQYYVKVQAVADKYGIYSDSALSYSINAPVVRTLDKPALFKIDDQDSPVYIQAIDNTNHYFLRFYGVQQASSYEVLVNGNRFNIQAKSPVMDNQTLYEYDITNYLTTAKLYTIKIRAIANESAINLTSSDYVTYEYPLYKQLDMVTQINIPNDEDNDGRYTVSFSIVNNAVSYRIRIVKLYDNGYLDYLNELNLPNPFETYEAADITDYVQQKGIYYVYVTALAPKNDENLRYYTDAKESETHGTIDKLESLSAPQNINFNNQSSDSFILSWTGDNNADYYLLKLTDPYGFDYQYNVYGTTSTNINDYMSVQGTYTVNVYSMVDSTSKEYISSSSTQATYQYSYNELKDFSRYKITMYGSDYDYVINNVNDLKSLLWYHYIYGIDSNTYLKVYINLQQDETIRDAILRLANEASGIYDENTSNKVTLHQFNTDATWLQKLQNFETDNNLFSYLCQTILGVYPELNILENFNLVHESNSQIFALYYENKLNQEKVDNVESTIKTTTDYGTTFTYLANFGRRSSTSTFAIDNKKEVAVSSTEQLLQAVQSNKKPKFTSNSAVAKTVYSNARAVLSAINTDEMTDLQKVTNIFNWLEYAYQLNYASNSNIVAGVLNPVDLEVYGLRKDYYLEGIFLGLNNSSSGGYDGEFYLGNRTATSESYSKAFTLLCAIEGIQSVVVNGTISYTRQGATTLIKHEWNKVYLSTTEDSADAKWFALDITNSDNKINRSNINSSYEISSHIYFLTTDKFLQDNLKTTEMSHLISEDYNLEHYCETSYDYYENSYFGLTKQELNETILDYGNTGSDLNNLDYVFKYSKKFISDYTSETGAGYEKYTNSGFSQLQAYIANGIIYAEHQRRLAEAKGQNAEYTSFEFRFPNVTNVGDPTPTVQLVRGVLENLNYYSVYLNLVSEGNSLYLVHDETDENSNSTIFVITLKKMS